MEAAIEVVAVVMVAAVVHRLLLLPLLLLPVDRNSSCIWNACFFCLEVLMGTTVQADRTTNVNGCYP